ncbi:hypothetical protein [Occallatibacter riparius]|uniref:Uncharacterized protein n=1 Tax=Occallatibacter riparius TaxID=1002689 RepID=A0A9J7BLC7_9BACT|nr:hypothetical protein [Occallatibacter riparius]UWZ83443.1 hypothetical protein MOP44_23110 [Occallatibacter riparius]
MPSDCGTRTSIHSRVENRTDTASPAPPSAGKGIARAFGLGVITGAANDDCSAVGTYSQAGAQFGYTLLATAPFNPSSAPSMIQRSLIAAAPPACYPSVLR